MTPRTLLPTLALALAGCAPSTVDLVQPGAVAKATFEGEWYWMNTVAEVPYGTASTFTGAQTGLERLRWRVEEDLLIGYRSYEHVVDANAPSGVGVTDEGIADAPLVAYPIEKHFDIRRQYDRRTGEESNVVVEDTERPWHERDYMRVDFSTNVADVGWTFAGVSLDVLDYATDDVSDDAAPQLDDTDSDGVIDSILLTQRVLAQPDTLLLPGYGDIPVCLFYGQAEYDCAATEVTIRSSFLRVEDDTPYQGLAYDDHWMETFGFFSTERMSYDRGHGIVEPNRTFWANRHDLWQDTYLRDDAGDIVCETPRGTRRACRRLTADDEPSPVVLDPRDRALRPVVYHAGPDFPADYLDAMADVADAWDEPLRQTVGSLRFWACVDAGGDAEDCEIERTVDERMFVFCPNNPSLPDDPAVCDTDHTGPTGRPDGTPDRALPGDLRYSFVHLVDQPQLSSPYGYGPSAADPVGHHLELADGTRLELGAGEILSGHAYLYTSVLDRIAHRTADLAGLLNGDIDATTYISGEDLQAWVDGTTEDGAAALSGRTHGLPAVWDEGAVRERAERINNGFLPLLQARGATARVGGRPDQTLATVRDATDRVEQEALLGTSADGLARFEAMAASPFAQQLWTEEVVGAMGYDPTTGGVAPSRNPLDLVHPMRQAELRQGRVLAGTHAVDLDDEQFADPSLVARARRWAREGKSYDQIVHEVQQEAFREVMLHEVGHTLGLRHNFAGSFDAFNYPEAYWALRDDGHMAPRHVDPETDAELDGGIRELQYASIMDYGGGRTTGWHGLGRYDEAAVKFGYGQLVEVMDDLPDDDAFPGIPNAELVGYVSVFNGSNVYPAPLLNDPSGGILELHYTDYPSFAGDLSQRADVPLSRLSTLLPGGAGFDDMMVVSDGAGVVEEGAPAAPFRFCSDEFAIGMTCARFDEGADAYEAQRFLMDQYWDGYVINNFARQRYGFGSAAGYISRLQGRIFEPLGTWQRYYALFHGLFEVDDDAEAEAFFVADRGFGGWTAATDESFRFLTQVVTRPEPGRHRVTTRADGSKMLVPTSGRFGEEIPLGAGAYYESEWDFDSGYHWFERQSRIGSYWDRMLALLALTDTSADGFMGYDTAADPQAYSIGYQDLYRDELALFLGRLMSDDLASLGPIRADDGELVYPDPLDMQAAWPPAGSEGSVVEPAAYWLVQFDAGLFGTSLLARGYDRSFLNRSRLYVEGSGDAIEPPEGQDTVSYTDPFSGKTYTAWSFPATRDGELLVGPAADIVELGSGARMVRRANLLRSYCTGELLPEGVDADDPGAVAAQQDLACAELERYASDLDLQLQLYAWFESQAPS